MRKGRREFEFFNMSFLDVISCGFGAVVLLVLISKYQIAPEKGEQEEISPLLAKVIELENQNEALASELDQLQESLASASQEAQELSKKAEIEANRRETERKRGQKLQDDLEGLELVEKSLKRATITPGKSPKTGRGSGWHTGR